MTFWDLYDNHKRMNIRQQKYKKNRILGMNCYNAARSAGYSETTAKSRTKQLEARIKITDVLERKGLTDSVLAEKLSELLNATKVIGYLHNYKKSEKVGIEKISPDEVISNEFLDIPDWQARGKGLELALKLKDLLRDKVEHSGEIKGGNRVVIIVQESNGNQSQEGRVSGRVSILQE